MPTAGLCSSLALASNVTCTQDSLMDKNKVMAASFSLDKRQCVSRALDLPVPIDPTPYDSRCVCATCVKA